MSLKYLRELAKDYGLPGIWKLRRNGLLQAIAEARGAEFVRRAKRMKQNPGKFPALGGDIENPHKRGQRNRELYRLGEEISTALRANSIAKRIEKNPNMRLKYLRKIGNRMGRRPVFGKPPESLARQIARDGPGILNKVRGPLVFQPTKWKIRDYLHGWKMEVPTGHSLGMDPKAFLEGVRPQIHDKLVEELQALGGLKFLLALRVQLLKLKPEGVQEYTDPVLRHKQEALLQANEIKEAGDKSIPHILELLEKWTQQGSGWIVDRVETLWLDIAKYEPVKGGEWFLTPAELAKKKATVNVKSPGQNCLRVAMKAAKFPTTQHVDRLSQYPTDDEDGFNFEGIDFPTPVSQIPKVEKQNNEALNVFGWDGKNVTIYHISKQPEGMSRINVLLFEKKDKFHYICVKYLDRLLYDQNKHKGRTYFCERCLHGYSGQELLWAHIPECCGIGKTAVRVEMPEEGKNLLSFQNLHKQMPAPFVIYADFEALCVKIDSEELDPTKSNTQNTQHHETCSYSYIVVRCDGHTKPPVEYRGPNAAEHFLCAIQKEEQKIKAILANPLPMQMTWKDWQTHNTATTCHICNKLLKDDSVKDHCHISGKYRGAAHNACNLRLRLSSKTTKIPVVFHNLRGYDSHLLMQAISKVGGKLSCIPNNTEKYISFTLGQLQFIDSIQFLLTSLDRLVKATAPESFHIVEKYVKDTEKRTLLLRKGVYPYEYMDGWERFDETALPPIEAFYSKLSDEHISKEDYKHAQQVWKVFECRTMGDYNDIYNRTDVLLLADVFETFRKTCRKQYGLDPAHYFSSPGLSWDALLKKTGIELELLTDYDQHLFIEKGLRGGISMVGKRFARANNPMDEGYDLEKPTKYIHYLDANNLYGWAMSQPLPVRGFRWVEDCDRLAETIVLHPEDDPIGYILEVDLEYSKELHETHNDYPLAPERMVVPREYMSEYQQQFLLGVGSTEVEKLVPNLHNKERYVLHYRNLQLYLSLGMRLQKIHRALRFEQSPWMEPYIRLNTELRKMATNDFEKDLYKLMNNSVFGKTMENLRKRVNVNLVRANEKDRMRKMIASPAFARANIFDDDLAAIQLHKSRLVLNKPVYVGMSVLDLSKNLMYDFYYNQIKKEYGDRCGLLYTDTDSLLLEIQTDDIYKDMAQNADLYDTSDYPTDHPLYTTKWKKVPGKMKDECAGRPIAEYVGLRPKMYSILESCGKNIRKAKGVRKATVKNHIRHEQYKESLFESRTFRHGMDILRSKKHRIYGQHLNKVSLSPFDSKRWIAGNGIDTYAYGYTAPPDAAEMEAYLEELLE